MKRITQSLATAFNQIRLKIVCAIIFLLPILGCSTLPQSEPLIIPPSLAMQRPKPVPLLPEKRLENTPSTSQSSTGISQKATNR